MPEGVVIADTGPLVAYLVEDDAQHDWAVEQFSRLTTPVLTCEAVLAETAHISRRYLGGLTQFFRLLDANVLVVRFDLMSERAAVGALARKYADVPMSLADACLVRMAELNEGAAVMTVDSDFRIYRKNGRQKIPLVMPPGR